MLCLIFQKENDMKRNLILITLTTLVVVCACIFGALSASGARGFSYEQRTVYVSDAGKGNGESASSPLGSLKEAFRMLSETGGTIVVCGKTSVKEITTFSENEHPIKITSSAGGKDYRKSSVTLTLSSDVTFRGDITLEKLDISFSAAVNIYAEYHDFTVGAEVTTARANASGTYRYPIIFGGYQVKDGQSAEAVSNDRDSVVQIDSGIWNTVVCGNNRALSTHAIGTNRAKSALVINGGTFNRTSDASYPVSATGMNYYTGQVVLEINGGEFINSVFAVMRCGSAVHNTKDKCTGDVLVRITGGEFKNTVGLTRAYDASAGNNAYNANMSVDGDATFVITGGSFTNEFITYCACGDLLLKYDPTRLQSNFLSLCTNLPIRQVIDASAVADTESKYVNATLNEQIDKNAHGADPYVVKDPSDDCYYYVYSSGGVKITKSGNIGFFRQGTTAVDSNGVNAYTKIYNGIKAVNHQDYSGSQPCTQYWAPEMHYIPREVAGDDWGWYIYVAASDSSNTDSAHRMYVYKSPEPDNPMCENWILKGKITDSSDYWAIDGTVFVWEGKMYFVWSGRESKGTSANKQNIYIASMSSPWQLSSERVMISSPTLSWERHQTSPAVNEGPQAFVYDGGLYVTYSANGSWAKNYCFGLLSYNGSGSLVDSANWSKRTTGPFFQKDSSNSKSPYGTGHGTVISALDGTPWIIFHANVDLKTSPSWWGRRMIFAQPLTLTGTGASLSGGVANSIDAQNTLPAHNGEYCTEHFYATESVEKGKITERCLICCDTHIEKFCEAYTHALGQWLVTKEASVDEAGEMKRDCLYCTYSETKATDKLEPPVTDGETFDTEGVTDTSAVTSAPDTTDTDTAGVTDEITTASPDESDASVTTFVDAETKSPDTTTASDTNNGGGSQIALWAVIFAIALALAVVIFTLARKKK